MYGVWCFLISVLFHSRFTEFIFCRVHTRTIVEPVLVFKNIQLIKLIEKAIWWKLLEILVVFFLIIYFGFQSLEIRLNKIEHASSLLKWSDPVNPFSPLKKEVAFGFSKENSMEQGKYRMESLVLSPYLNANLMKWMETIWQLQRWKGKKHLICYKYFGQ